MRRGRLFAAGVLGICAATLAVLVFGGIGDNLVYYWSPTELREAGEVRQGAKVRLGGRVKPGSVTWKPDAGKLRFTVTDGTHEVPVRGDSAPPQMFREGTGVVLEGHWRDGGYFETERLMVKHDNSYEAPEDGEKPAFESLARDDENARGGERARDEEGGS